MIELPVFPTSVIGSYPRPKYLKEMIRLRKAGKVSDKHLREAFDDAIIAVVKEQEMAGIDIPSDGEQRRDEMVEYFAERIEGFRFYGPVRVWGNAYYKKPAVIGPLKYKRPIVVNEYLFLRKISSAPVVKVTITGPYTIADWSFNEYYNSKEELASELAKIINRELMSLEDVGAKFVQIDEPALPTHEDEIEWAVDIINESIKGIRMKIGMHVCYGNYWRLVPYFEKLKVSQLALEFANRNFRDIELIKRLPEDKELGFGVIDVHNRRVERPEEVAEFIKRVLRIISPERLYINPDCGLKLLPREIAREKLENMVRGVKMLRSQFVKIRGPVIY